MTQLVKTDTFFIIHNFNTDPEHYLRYCHDYHIYDQSTDPIIKERLKANYSKITFVDNSGHNISSYFRFFIDNYDKLPSWMMLVKANMIGRHLSQDFFERVFCNKKYTFLYEDKNWIDKQGIAYQPPDGGLMEINNSWYAFTKPYRYFLTLDDLLCFLFKDPVIPDWLYFSPGACYIVSSDQVLKYPVAFYRNLLFLVSYTYFPSEAYHVERLLNIIFSGKYELNEYCLDEGKFMDKINARSVWSPKGIKWSAQVRKRYWEIKLRTAYAVWRLKNFFFNFT
ncbi:DUF3431 domain-containing protein [Citrifermentans bremense]|uniref:DUF3431 domain-containing protein n=1 Tax=Citrifermentans bremense TaxID=60035 RepID=UPI00068413D5|nr:DUF3431 domain-containing protein [Citrifermentans bremense]